MKKFAVFVIAALCLVNCGGGNEFAGVWELVDPDTGLALGETLTMSEDGSWSRNGTPSYEGTYKWESGELLLVIDLINGMARTESVESAVSAGMPRDDVEKQMDKLDEAMSFELKTEDGEAYLVQLHPLQGSRTLKFRKRPTE